MSRAAEGLGRRARRHRPGDRQAGQRAAGAAPALAAGAGGVPPTSGGRPPRRARWRSPGSGSRWRWRWRSALAALALPHGVRARSSSSISAPPASTVLVGACSARWRAGPTGAGSPTCSRCWCMLWAGRPRRDARCCRGRLREAGACRAPGPARAGRAAPAAGTRADRQPHRRSAGQSAQRPADARHPSRLRPRHLSLGLDGQDLQELHRRRVGRARERRLLREPQPGRHRRPDRPLPDSDAARRRRGGPLGQARLRALVAARRRRRAATCCAASATCWSSARRRSPTR